MSSNKIGNKIRLIIANKTTRYILLFWVIFNIIMFLSFSISVLALYNYELNHTELELLTTARQSASLISNSISSNKLMLSTMKKELQSTSNKAKVMSIFKSFYNEKIKYFGLAKQDGTLIYSYPQGFELPIQTNVYGKYIFGATKKCLHTLSYCIVPSYVFKNTLIHFDTFPIDNKTFLIKATTPILVSIQKQICLPYKSLDLGVIRHDSLMQASIPPKGIGKLQSGVLAQILKNNKEDYGTYEGYSSAYKADKIGAFSKIAGFSLYFFVSIKKSEFISKFLNSILPLLAIVPPGVIASFIIIIWILNKTIYTEAVKRRQEKGIKYIAYHDILTHIPNRAFFEMRFSQMVAALNRQQRRMALILLDLDGFKNINDTLGHDGGDQALKTVSKIFKSNIRAQDTLARIGGDEFAILADSFNSESDLINIAKRIMHSVNKLIFTNNMDLNISVSIGIAYAYKPATKEVIFKAADDALYQSKAKGKNAYTILNI